VKVLSRSVVHIPCQKLLCGGCFDFLKASSCPNCTIKFVENSTRARTDIDRRVSTESKLCVCGQSVLFNAFDDHYDRCEAAQSNLNSTVKKALLKPDVEVVNRATFKCPFCAEKNFVRETLITHIEQHHGRQAGVCPICVAMPWGDPNIVSDNLLSHLKHRHKYDVDTYTDFAMDDEEILRRVLEESKSCR